MENQVTDYTALIQNACTDLGVVWGDVKIEKLRGDASSRSFFRLTGASPKLPDSVIVMCLPSSMFDQFAPICATRAYFSKIGVPVPEVFFDDSRSGIVFFEDFGDNCLELAVKQCKDPLQVRRWYKQALDIVVRMQADTVEQISRGTQLVAFGLAFDEEKLGFEMNFFLEHFVKGYMGFADNDALLGVKAAFDKMCVLLAGRPRYIAHRDYHSRNLIVKPDGNLGVIDFQDARMGPVQYDAVSLLRDSYVDIGTELRGQMLDYYKNSLQKQPGIDTADFDLFFEWTALQRNIKALGTFGYMVSKAGKKYFEESIPLTLGYVRKSLKTGGPFSEMNKALSPVLDQLA